jgi:pseudoazurin
MLIMRIKVMAAVAAAAMASVLYGVAPASAAEHEVKMLNKGAAGMMVFEPSFLKIAPGDTVHFVAADKGHNVMSVDGMIPAGATPFMGKMNEDLTVTFDKPGVYGFECKPHYGMGMVGLVVVGDPINLADAKAVPQKGKAKKGFEELLGKVAQ